MVSLFLEGDSFDGQSYMRPSETTFIYITPNYSIRNQRLHRKITEIDIWFPNDFEVAALQSACLGLLLY